MTSMAGETKKPNQKLQAWTDARKRHHLSDAQVQMARELGMNPAKLGKLDNHKQEPWKLPLPQFIEELYFKRRGTRNSLIMSDLMRALDDGRSPILLTERRDHLEYFAEQLGNTTRRFTVLHGGMRAKERRELATRVAERHEGDGHVVLATGRYIGERFDDARLDTLFLAMPISWKGTLVQYTGRLHRLHPGKKEIRIYDYVDCEVPMLLRMFEKRLRTYRAIGYARGEAPLGLAEPPAESSVETDEEGLCHFEEKA
jgi:hypothetical protein